MHRKRWKPTPEELRSGRPGAESHAANTHGPCAAVFDLGRSFAKLSVVTSEGHVLSEARIATPTRHTGLYDAIDTDTLYGWMIAQLKAVASLHPIDRIIPVAHGAACAFLDQKGNLVQPVQDYEFPIPAEYIEAYARMRPVFEETLSPALPRGLNLGAQIFWHSRRDPKAFAKVRWILTYPQYWAYRLSGVMTAEVTSLGCHTDLWAPAQADFSSLAYAQGWAECFAPLKSAWETAGTLRPDIARTTRLPATTRVCVGVHDTNAALAVSRQCGSQFGGEPFGSDGMAMLSTGTWFIAMAPGARLDRLQAERDCLGAVDIYGEQVACARFMGGRAFEVITRGRTGVPVDAATLRAVMRDCAMALPSFLEAGGPYPGHRGEIRGLRRDTPATRAALGLLYQALLSHTCLEMIQSGRPLLIEGMAARNPTLCGLIAALHDAPVFVNTDVSGVTLGAAALAFKDEAAPPIVGYSRAEPLLANELQAYRRHWLNAVESDHAA